jgi:hypothetical protein
MSYVFCFSLFQSRWLKDRMSVLGISYKYKIHHRPIRLTSNIPTLLPTFQRCIVLEAMAARLCTPFLGSSKMKYTKPCFMTSPSSLSFPHNMYSKKGRQHLLMCYAKCSMDLDISLCSLFWFSLYSHIPSLHPHPASLCLQCLTWDLKCPPNAAQFHKRKSRMYM